MQENIKIWRHKIEFTRIEFEVLIANFILFALHPIKSLQINLRVFQNAISLISKLFKLFLDKILADERSSN